MKGAIVLKKQALLVYAVGLAVTATHGAITLTDLQNRKATVEIVAASPAALTVEAQGRRMPVALDQLSPESRQAALDYAKSKGVFNAFPAVSVQFKVAYQRRNTKNSSYKIDTRATPSFVIEGVRKMEAIPPAEATVVLITHDTRERYVKHVDKMKVNASETIQVPAAANGDRREFLFKTMETTFDAARDPTNVGGQEYRYYIFGLRDPETKQLIDFQTNSVKLKSYVAAHPETRETFLSAAISASFTEDFPDK